MRILSQKADIDVPYELVAIHRKDRFIRMNMAGEAGSGSALATYSTESKAIKAMDMLHEKYKSYDVVSNGVQGLVSAFVAPKVFHFPKDEDLEVDDGRA